MDINTIATMAGVSRATVSRYLNNGYVSDEKRKRIAEIIKQTGYVPSRQAQILRTGRTNVIGVIIPKINSASISRMVSGLSKVLSAAGYQILLANTANVAQTELQYLKLFSDTSSVDGIILSATMLTPEHVEVLDDLTLPHVILGQQLDGHRCVYYDDYHAVRDITLFALNHGKHPAFIGVTDEDTSAGLARHKGFLDACHTRGIEPESRAQMVADFNVDSGYLICELLLAAYPEVDTIVCATDRIAAGAMACLREYGKRIPEDVQVTGVGDSDLARVVTPTMTTVNHHYKSSGEEAARMLLDGLGKAKDSAQQVCMTYELYTRGSTRWD